MAANDVDRRRRALDRAHEVSQRTGDTDERGTMATRCMAPPHVGADGEVTPGEFAIVGAVRARALRSDRGESHIEQPATSAEAFGAGAVGQEAVVTNAMEAVRQRVEEEAADELAGFERHDLGVAAVAIVLPGEPYRPLVERE